jgi:tumor protein p53-inducible protein 3
VLFGLMGGPKVDGAILGNILRKRIRITGTTLRARPIEYKAKLVAAFVEQSLPLIGDGMMKAVVDTTFPMAEVAAAHLHMEARCAFCDRNLHSRMPWDPTPARLKRAGV